MSTAETEKARICTQQWKELLDSSTVEELEAMFCSLHGGDRCPLEQFQWEHQHIPREFYRSELALNVAVKQLDNTTNTKDATMNTVTVTITFNFIDICYPDFLQDSHNRDGECLVAIPFDTQSNYFSDKHEFAEDVAGEAMAYCESLWEHLPEDDDEALELLACAVLDEIDGMNFDIDDDEDTDEDDECEPLVFYGYFSWTVEPAVESVAIELDDASFQSYLETALWSSTDDDGNPRDTEFGSDDSSVFDSDGFNSQRRQCEQFINDNCVTIAAVMAEGIPLPQIMHDLWLTRNGHGAGFWDGNYPEPYATLLTDSAEKLGEVDVYAGDDDVLYFS